MLMPKKVKYRYKHRGKLAGIAKRGSAISFGDFGLKALEADWVTANQLEAARIAMNRAPARAL